MPTDLLSLRIAPRVTPDLREHPDPAVAAMPGLIALRDTLRLASQVPELLPRPRFPAAKVFFFQPDSASEPTVETDAVDPWSRAARHAPDAVRAWRDVFPRVADVFPALANCVAVRHSARAIPNLVRFTEQLAPNHPAAAELAEILAVADDLTVLAIDPAAQVGVRVRTIGVSDVAQLHVLLAQALPGVKPSEEVLAAYSDGDPLDPPIATARFQIFHPRALRPDGTLPTGFSGTDDWIWGTTRLRKLPHHLGIRVILLGKPAYPAQWEAIRRVPQVSGRLQIENWLPADAVREWITERTTPISNRELHRRAA